MSSPWFPGAIRDPGLNAGYRRGRIAPLVDVSHFTVGRDSRALIRDRGLAHFLYPKVGPPIQFAPVDAACSHACEWIQGVGHELERMGWHEPFTEDQTRWVGEVVRWRNREWGVPLAHHHAGSGRLPIGSAFRGTADHGGLVHRKCDQHTDGWTDQEWTAILAASGGAPSTGENMPLGFFARSATDPRVWLVEGGRKTYIQTPEAINVLVYTGQAKSTDVAVLPQSFLDALEDTSHVSAKPVPVDYAALASAVEPLVRQAVGEQSTWLARFFRAGWPRKAERGQVP